MVLIGAHGQQTGVGRDVAVVENVAATTPMANVSGCLYDPFLTNMQDMFITTSSYYCY